jgi:hypothetical protein
MFAKRRNCLRVDSTVFTRGWLLEVPACNLTLNWCQKQPLPGLVRTGEYNLKSNQRQNPKALAIIDHLPLGLSKSPD